MLAVAVLATGLLLVACGPAGLTGTAETVPTSAEESTPSRENTPTREQPDVPAVTVLPGTPIPDQAGEELMYEFLQGNSSERRLALGRILAAQDRRFVGVLIELMRAAQIGLIPQEDFVEIISTLEALSGQQLGDDWPAWVEWYGATGLVPPPGFTTWKGELLSRIDPRFADFLKDEYPSVIRVEEIMWGGVRVDGIPALDNPAMILPAEAGYLEPGEPVFGLALNGEARAYPLRILDWHEMANDVVGGVPVSLAYCTLCGSGIAFDGRASDGETYTFGSSGFLFRSNKLMYDRQTNTLWNQLTGEPVLGGLAGSELRLEVLPVVLTAWSDWLEQHPETLVLSLETGHGRIYEPGAAYGDYFSSEGTMFPVWQRSQELPPKARVYALRVNGVPKAYALEKLVAEEVLNDTLGGEPVVLVAQRGAVEVQGESLRAGAVSYDSGGEVRAYARGDHTFSPGAEAGLVLDEQGREWRVAEEALLGPEGESAPRLGGHLAYWFGWFAFFPNTELAK